MAEANAHPAAHVAAAADEPKVESRAQIQVPPPPSTIDFIYLNLRTRDGGNESGNSNLMLQTVWYWIF
jgi:hypothetical protein